ncbi:MAG TPA: hypothetical protein VFE24_17535, partial [Pirellulales bacterium]|nr:hypothetical protein [Pirellulales bacterium]
MLTQRRCFALRCAMVLAASYCLVGAPSSASALNITAAGDPIGGGNLAGSIFTIGSPDGGGGTDLWPTTETPANSIDGNSATKYLNRIATNSGYIVTPAFGVSKVTGIAFTTANDTISRDPASYALYGSNTVSASSTVNATFNLSDFTMISSGNIALSDTRLDSTVSVAFANALNYTTYLLVFPTTKGTVNSNSDGTMQIADAILTGTGAISGGTTWASTSDTSWANSANWNPPSIPSGQGQSVSFGVT